MKIAFFEVEHWEDKLLKKQLSKDKIIFSSNKLTSRNANKYKNVEVVAVFVNSVVDKKVLDKLQNLKFIATMSTGFDHIDLEECHSRGIKVSNVPVYGVNTVAEHAFSLILSLSRKVIACVNRTTKGKFNLEGLCGFDLKGKTIGVIGSGNIGKRAIKMAHGFDMNILVFDLFKDKKFAKQFNFKYVTLEKLFKNSDIVTIHVPYNKHTHHLVNKKLLSLMKKGSYIVNTSRGGVMDTRALYSCLKSGKLAGAGLDVLEEEKAIFEEAKNKKADHWKSADKEIIKINHKLMKMKNVLITPHNAFNTKEALIRILNTTVSNIKGYNRKRYVNLVK